MEDLSRAIKRKDKTMPISISMIVVGTHLVVAVADRVPAFDVSRSCKLDVAATSRPFSRSVPQELRER